MPVTTKPRVKSKQGGFRISANVHAILSSARANAAAYHQYVALTSPVARGASAPFEAVAQSQHAAEYPRILDGYGKEHCKETLHPPESAQASPRTDVSQSQSTQSERLSEYCSDHNREHSRDISPGNERTAAASRSSRGLPEPFQSRYRLHGSPTTPEPKRGQTVPSDADVSSEVPSDELFELSSGSPSEDHHRPSTRRSAPRRKRKASSRATVPYDQSQAQSGRRATSPTTASPTLPKPALRPAHEARPTRQSTAVHPSLGHDAILPNGRLPAHLEEEPMSSPSGAPPGRPGATGLPPGPSSEGAPVEGPQKGRLAAPKLPGSPTNFAQHLPPSTPPTPTPTPVYARPHTPQGSPDGADGAGERHRASPSGAQAHPPHLLGEFLPPWPHPRPGHTDQGRAAANGKSPSHEAATSRPRASSRASSREEQGSSSQPQEMLRTPPRRPGPTTSRTPTPPRSHSQGGGEGEEGRWEALCKDVRISVGEFDARMKEAVAQHFPVDGFPLFENSSAFTFQDFAEPLLAMPPLSTTRRAVSEEPAPAPSSMAARGRGVVPEGHSPAHAEHPRTHARLEQKLAHEVLTEWAAAAHALREATTLTQRFRVYAVHQRFRRSVACWRQVTEECRRRREAVTWWVAGRGATLRALGALRWWRLRATACAEEAAVRLAQGAIRLLRGRARLCLLRWRERSTEARGILQRVLAAAEVRRRRITGTALAGWRGELRLRREMTGQLQAAMARGVERVLRTAMRNWFRVVAEMRQTAVALASAHTALRLSQALAAWLGTALLARRFALACMTVRVRVEVRMLRAALRCWLVALERRALQAVRVVHLRSQRHCHVLHRWGAVTASRRSLRSRAEWCQALQCERHGRRAVVAWATEALRRSEARSRAEALQAARQERVQAEVVHGWARLAALRGLCRGAIEDLRRRVRLRHMQGALRHWQGRLELGAYFESAAHAAAMRCARRRCGVALAAWRQHRLECAVARMAGTHAARVTGRSTLRAWRGAQLRARAHAEVCRRASAARTERLLRGAVIKWRGAAAAAAAGRVALQQLRALVVRHVRSGVIQQWGRLVRARLVERAVVLRFLAHYGEVRALGALRGWRLAARVCRLRIRTVRAFQRRRRPYRLRRSLDQWRHATHLQAHTTQGVSMLAEQRLRDMRAGTTLRAWRQAHVHTRDRRAQLERWARVEGGRRLRRRALHRWAGHAAGARQERQLASAVLCMWQHWSRCRGRARGAARAHCKRQARAVLRGWVGAATEGALLLQLASCQVAARALQRVFRGWGRRARLSSAATGLCRHRCCVELFRMMVVWGAGVRALHRRRAIWRRAVQLSWGWSAFMGHREAAQLLRGQLVAARGRAKRSALRKFRIACAASARHVALTLCALASWRSRLARAVLRSWWRAVVLCRLSCHFCDHHRRARGVRALLGWRRWAGGSALAGALLGGRQEACTRGLVRRWRLAVRVVLCRRWSLLQRAADAWRAAYRQAAREADLIMELQRHHSLSHLEAVLRGWSLVTVAARCRRGPGIGEVRREFRRKLQIRALARWLQMVAMAEDERGMRALQAPVHYTAVLGCRCLRTWANATGVALLHRRILNRHVALRQRNIQLWILRAWCSQVDERVEMQGWAADWLQAELSRALDEGRGEAVSMEGRSLGGWAEASLDLRRGVRVLRAWFEHLVVRRLAGAAKLAARAIGRERLQRRVVRAWQCAAQRMAWQRDAVDEALQRRVAPRRLRAALGAWVEHVQILHDAAICAHKTKQQMVAELQRSQTLKWAAAWLHMTGIARRTARAWRAAVAGAVAHAEGYRELRVLSASLAAWHCEVLRERTARLQAGYADSAWHAQRYHRLVQATSAMAAVEPRGVPTGRVSSRVGHRAAHGPEAGRLHVSSGMVLDTGAGAAPRSEQPALWHHRHHRLQLEHTAPQAVAQQAIHAAAAPKAPPAVLRGLQHLAVLTEAAAVETAAAAAVAAAPAEEGDHLTVQSGARDPRGGASRKSGRLDGREVKEAARAASSQQARQVLVTAAWQAQHGRRGAERLESSAGVNARDPFATVGVALTAATALEEWTPLRAAAAALEPQLAEPFELLSSQAASAPTSPQPQPQPRARRLLLGELESPPGGTHDPPRAAHDLLTAAFESPPPSPPLEVADSRGVWATESCPEEVEELLPATPLPTASWTAGSPPEGGDDGNPRVHAAHLGFKPSSPAPPSPPHWSVVPLEAHGNGGGGPSLEAPPWAVRGCTAATASAAARDPLAVAADSAVWRGGMDNSGGGDALALEEAVTGRRAEVCGQHRSWQAAGLRHAAAPSAPRSPPDPWDRAPQHSNSSGRRKHAAGVSWVTGKGGRSQVDGAGQTPGYDHMQLDAGTRQGALEMVLAKYRTPQHLSAKPHGCGAGRGYAAAPGRRAPLSSGRRKNPAVRQLNKVEVPSTHAYLGTRA
ncbi:hypothetical protein CYMTET_48951 [Cymbomonas tetramitiformis]|uniref:Sfi1 spindle body domain-containing protein n=1 Tax=Cymbomonas tetramitiformis TaxID=36881 RepID=A0AAE0BRA5_9CHLO|nr:hypothetical protein CYMTET_48951 [Cymbomonas tetramitiformis]